MKRRKFFLSLGLAVSASMAGFLRPIKLSTPNPKYAAICQPWNGDTVGSVTRATVNYLTPSQLETLFS